MNRQNEKKHSSPLSIRGIISFLPPIKMIISIILEIALEDKLVRRRVEAIDSAVGRRVITAACTVDRLFESISIRHECSANASDRNSRGFRFDIDRLA